LCQIVSEPVKPHLKQTIMADSLLPNPGKFYYLCQLF